MARALGIADVSRDQIQAEPLVAWRAWAYTDAGLRALVGRGLWAPHAARARCTLDHEPPVASCACGWYGAKRLATALSWARAYWDTRRGRTVVIGRAALWGRVIEHEHGYRAEYAYPQVLYVVGSPRAVHRLEGLYHVEAYPSTWEALEERAVADLAASDPPRLPPRPRTWLVTVPAGLQVGLALVVARTAAHLPVAPSWAIVPLAAWTALWIAAASIVPDPWEYERALARRSRGVARHRIVARGR